MTYRLLFEKRVFKDLDRVPEREFIRIDRTIRLLPQNPLPPGSKKLVGEHNLYRVRQGSYRIIYSVDHRAREIRVLGIRHRKDAYR